MSCNQEQRQESTYDITESALMADLIIAELKIKIEHNTLIGVTAGTNRNNVIGNVVGFLPLYVRIGDLTKEDALRILNEFNNRTGYQVRWDDLGS
ncbi:MAG TPA: hypothetical protein PKX78_00665 [Candidatus Woesebacteria bacterium]|jgi:hypothetical protein|nr:hypothetical protein [Candidatus Woesebacteria bacterium]